MNTLSRSLLILTGLLVTGAAVAYGQAPGPPPVELPYTGNRTGVWIVAQLHILFCSLYSRGSDFCGGLRVVGYKNNDPKYDRLAKEVTKVTVILYSMTALTGGLFIFGAASHLSRFYDVVGWALLL